ncbi:MAG: ATP-binding cassette domain-containing protein [Actinobacteria bacterium]|nr:ATP-binding cassette domain-containing protein [Actinomycetota bacterium]MCL5882553.1 ATP-binding cassette domain-containing protein [Actinomycetota bacterium]
MRWEVGDELVTLFGFSGSGKTMTLQLIAGLMRPDEGYIEINGRQYFDSGSGLDVKPGRRRTGYVFQDSALFPHMTVKENIAYGLTRPNASERIARVDEMIDIFRLGGLEGARPREISGGQKQRVALARALIGRPELLMLDEPFSALDRPFRARMQNIIRDIRSEFSIPVILVTHDYSEVDNLADKVIVYSGGKVVQQGSPLEIRKNPADGRVRELIGIG